MLGKIGLNCLRHRFHGLCHSNFIRLANRVAKNALGALLVLLPIYAIAANGDYIALCYHSVPEKYDGDPMAVSAENFISQLSWLRNAGYKAVSMDDILSARIGKKTLPDKAFLITVDDGYLNFYTNIFPILKLYRYPAVFGVVGSWIEDPLSATQNSVDKYFKKQRFVTWAQLKEMADSGLVEIASHSYDLHHGILANPQVNQEPAAITLQYDAAKKTYETPEDLRSRVSHDLQRNSDLIYRNVGVRPRIMVWPYGAYNQIGLEGAQKAGMPITFTLDEGMANVKNVLVTNRALIERDPRLDTFTFQVQNEYLPSGKDPMRAVTVNLDSIYDPDPEVQNTKLGRVLDYLAELGVNTVYLKPYVTSPDGTRTVRAVYFPNRVLPLRGDLLNRVAWQIRSRLGINIYVIMPLSDFTDISRDGSSGGIKDAENRQRIKTLYQDMARNVPINGGIVFSQEPTDEAELAFMKELINEVGKIRPPSQPLYTGVFMTAPYAGDWLKRSNQLLEGFEFVVADADQLATASGFHKAIGNPEWARKVVLNIKIQEGDGWPASAFKLLDRIRSLQRLGALNFGLGADNFLRSAEGLNIVKLGVSLRSNPHIKLNEPY